MKRISPATVIACVALFFSFTGAGMAATGYRITSLWQISPRVRHELRGTAGPRGITGAQGPQGAVGPQGPQGPAGGAGTLDLSDAQVVMSSVVALSHKTPSSVAVTCPLGDQALNGGADGNNDIVTETIPGFGLAGVIGWSATAHLEPGAPNGSVQAWAECIPS